MKKEPKGRLCDNEPGVIKHTQGVVRHGKKTHHVNAVLTRELGERNHAVTSGIPRATEKIFAPEILYIRSARAG